MQNSCPPRYSTELERQMKRFYRNLSEKNQRLYAAVEAEKFPQNGIAYIAAVLECDPEIIYRGIEELRAIRLDEVKGHVQNIGH